MNQRGKTLSIAEIKMLIESGDINNKFIPISTDKILISNNAYIFENDTVELTVEYEGQEEPMKSTRRLVFDTRLSRRTF